MEISHDENTVLDIHLATDALSPELERILSGMGFRTDRFVGGTTGVLHRHHFSKHPKNVEELKTLWQDTLAQLQGRPREHFCGYAEAEVVAPQFNQRIESRKFVPSVPLPFERLRHERCPMGKYKECDFHVSANLATLDPRLEDILHRQLGFYYVDIAKQSGLTYRVFTFQPLGIQESLLPHYRALVDYLRETGGMEGKVKLETTYAYQRFPEDAEVPPVITSLPHLLDSSSTDRAEKSVSK